jgi:biopolymer transport protein ExbB/TolQ
MFQLKDSNLLLRALIIVGLVGFGFFLAADQGLVTLALDSDQSYISYLILAVYLLASLHWLWLANTLGDERKTFAALEDQLQQNLDISHIQRGLIGGFLGNLRQRHLDSNNESSTHSLIEAVGDELANRHALGHFLSDVLLKLGLLGTIVGFILMLLPIGDIKEFDPTLMQQLLATMGSGMAVALYTTLAGLITSTLLKLQYHVLDASAAELITRLSVLSDVRYKALAT